MKRPNINRNILFIILEGIAAAVILNLFNPFTQMFAKRMGADDFHIALINSLPPLVAILVLIPCSIFIEKIQDKKLVTCILIAFNSVFYVLIAFSPNWSHEIRAMIYVILIGLMNWPGALYTTTWQSFFSYTFKENEANYIYSLRSKYGAFFGLLTVLTTGLVLSVIPKNDDQRILIYQFFYIACFVISITQIFLLSKVKQDKAVIEKQHRSKSSLITFKGIREIAANKPFLIFCACAFLFHISWQMGWPLFFLYNVDCIKVNEFQLGLINVASGLASFLSFSSWNKLAGKKGNSFVIIIGALGLASNPFFYTGIMPFYIIIIVNIVVGAAAAAFNLMLFCNLLEILPESKKTIYISLFNTFINISGFVAPLMGVWLNRHTGIFRAMFIIGILRVLGAGLFALRWYTGKRGKKVEIGFKQTEGGHY